MPGTLGYPPDIARGKNAKCQKASKNTLPRRNIDAPPHFFKLSPTFSNFNFCKKSTFSFGSPERYPEGNQESPAFNIYRGGGDHSSIRGLRPGALHKTIFGTKRRRIGTTRSRIRDKERDKTEKILVHDKTEKILPKHSKGP